MPHGMRELSALNNSSLCITEGGGPAGTLNSSTVKLELSALLQRRTPQSLENIVRQIYLEVVAISTVDRMFESSPVSPTYAWRGL